MSRICIVGDADRMEAGAVAIGRIAGATSAIVLTRRLCISDGTE